MNEKFRKWSTPSADFELGDAPLIMGIVNVTPDSFSDGGRFPNVDAAVRHAMQLADDGADLLDVGGESTRPGAEPVDTDVEIDRVIPVIQILAGRVKLPISIDTTKAEVVRLALDAGATIVNDVSGLTFDPQMVDVCRDAEAGVVCMHIRGTPQTMQDDPRYEDVVEEVREWLSRRLDALEEAGIPLERIVIDPGVGFGKTAEHNLAVLSNIRRFRDLGRPVLVGHSRKRFLKHILGREIDERTSGTLGVAIALAMQSTDVLRVHDVRATRDALAAWRAVMERINTPV